MPEIIRHPSKVSVIKHTHALCQPSLCPLVFLRHRSFLRCLRAPTFHCIWSINSLDVFSNQAKRSIHFRGHIPDSERDDANLRTATQSASTVSSSRMHSPVSWKPRLRGFDVPTGFVFREDDNDIYQDSQDASSSFICTEFRGRVSELSHSKRAREIRS